MMKLLSVCLFTNKWSLIIMGPLSLCLFGNKRSFIFNFLFHCLLQQDDNNACVFGINKILNYNSIQNAS